MGKGKATRGDYIGHRTGGLYFRVVIFTDSFPLISDPFIFNIDCFVDNGMLGEVRSSMKRGIHRVGILRACSDVFWLSHGG